MGDLNKRTTPFDVLKSCSPQLVHRNVGISIRNDSTLEPHALVWGWGQTSLRVSDSGAPSLGTRVWNVADKWYVVQCCDRAHLPQVTRKYKSCR